MRKGNSPNKYSIDLTLQVEFFSEYFLFLFQATNITEAIERAAKEVNELKKNVPKDPFKMTAKKQKSRLKTPTVLSNCNSQELLQELQVRQCSLRRSETMTAALAIHGGTVVNRKPALDGLWMTTVKKASVKDLRTYCKNSKKIKNGVFPKVQNEETRSYKGSNDNMLRSLNILYDGGLMSKWKYKLTRSNLSFEANN